MDKLSKKLNGVCGNMYVMISNIDYIRLTGFLKSRDKKIKDFLFGCSYSPDNECFTIDFYENDYERVFIDEFYIENLELVNKNKIRRFFR